MHLNTTAKFLSIDVQYWFKKIQTIESGSKLLLSVINIVISKLLLLLQLLLGFDRWQPYGISCSRGRQFIFMIWNLTHISLCSNVTYDVLAPK